MFILSLYEVKNVSYGCKSIRLSMVLYMFMVHYSVYAFKMCVKHLKLFQTRCSCLPWTPVKTQKQWEQGHHSVAIYTHLGKCIKFLFTLEMNACSFIYFWFDRLFISICHVNHFLSFRQDIC